jgi:hypothetical protein
MTFSPLYPLDAQDNIAAKSIRHLGRTIDFIDFKVPKRYGPLDLKVELAR